MKMRWAIYAQALLITVAIFALALVLSDHFYKRRLREIGEIERRIALDLLSSDVSFELLAEAPCMATSTPPFVREIEALASRLEFLERERGANDSEVELLKSRYSLLEIKDLLVQRRTARECGGEAEIVVYFYSNKPGGCAECEKQGYVLSALREAHPDIRIYSFDYDLDISGVAALKEIYGVEPRLPALVVGRVPYYGFRSIEEVETLLMRYSGE